MNIYEKKIADLVAEGKYDEAAEIMAEDHSSSFEGYRCLKQEIQFLIMLVRAQAHHEITNPEEPKKGCTCHERDSSYTCQSCKAEGLCGHMEDDL